MGHARSVPALPRRSLADRLAAAGVEIGEKPMAAWRRLFEVEGPRATIVDLYALVAAPRGLAPHELPVAERERLARSVMTLIWPGYELTPGSARPTDRIELLEYDPGWPARFSAWRARIETRLGPVRVEHVGSTAVPGLVAKPSIDVQVSVPSTADEDGYLPGLVALGLQLRSRDEMHRYFRPFPDKPRDVHVHVCAVGSSWERDHVLFRDYLRAHPEVRDEYAEVKRTAARAWADDRLGYTDAKSEFILDAMDAAKAWAAGAGQSS